MARLNEPLAYLDVDDDHDGKYDRRLFGDDVDAHFLNLPRPRYARASK